METTVFQYSRGPTAIYLSVSAVLAMLTTGWATRDRTEPAYLAAVFFVCASAALAWQLLRPRQLLLDSEGFTVSGGYTWRPTKILWRDVENFYVAPSGRGGKIIGFNFTPPQRDPVRLADYAPRQKEVGTISLGWDQSAEDIVSELNRYRKKSAA